jgi:hypothetical protein
MFRGTPAIIVSPGYRSGLLPQSHSERETRAKWERAWRNSLLAIVLTLLTTIHGFAQINPPSIGPFGGTNQSPACYVDGSTNANIAACITYLNSLGVTGTGTIYSNIPEDITSQIFVNPPFSGTIFLNNDIGTSTTCNQTGTPNCWVTEVPLILPARLYIRGIGAAGTGSGIKTSSGTAITFGSTFPAPIGFSGTLGTPVCGTTPPGHLHQGLYNLQVTLINNLMGGSTTPATPGRGSASLEKTGISCPPGITNSIVWSITNVPTAGAGFAAQEMAVYITAPNGLQGTELEATSVSCPLTAPGTVDLDGGSCTLPTSGGGTTVSFTVTDAGATGPPPPLVDTSNPMIVEGTGPDTGNANAVELRDLTLFGSPTGSFLPLANEPGVGVLGYTAQEQSGTSQVACYGAFTSACIYSGFNSNNSHHVGLNAGSSQGPGIGSFSTMILDGRMLSGGTARYVSDGTMAAHCAGCGSFKLTRVDVGASNAVYTGTITGGASGGGTGIYTGSNFSVSGFMTGANNIVNQPAIASTDTTLTFVKGGGQVTETMCPTSPPGNTCSTTFKSPSVTNPAQILVTGAKAYTSLSGVHTENASGNCGINVTNSANATISGFEGHTAGTSIYGNSLLCITHLAGFAAAGNVWATIQEDNATAPGKYLVQDDTIPPGTGNCNTNNSYCFISTVPNQQITYSNGNIQPSSQTTQIQTSQINDFVNNLRVFAFTGVPSAVDYITATNAAAANPATVSLTATGSDTNISINLVPQGTGAVECNSLPCFGVSGTINSGGIPYFSSTAQESSSALLALSHVLLGGGTGAAPSSDANLSDVSNTLTYTGAGGISAPILTSTVSTGAPFTVSSQTTVTNLSAGLLAGASWPSPSAIGSTTPNTGAFTTLSVSTSMKIADLVISATAPTISSGFGSFHAIGHSNGTAVFTIGVGSAPGNTGVLAMPSAANGWYCTATDETTTSSSVFVTKQIVNGSPATSVTLGNFTTGGAAGPWNSNDVLLVSCAAY